MKVIFLDFDGVLNSITMERQIEAAHDAECKLTFRSTGQHCNCFDAVRRFDRVCVARLNTLVERTSAVIVLSTSWRKMLDVPTCTHVLRQNGLVGEVIGETPDLPNDPTWLAAKRAGLGGEAYFDRIERGHEIDEWLTQHPEVEEFVILDDCSDMARLKPCLVQTDDMVGLTDADVERAAIVMGESRALLAVLS